MLKKILLLSSLFVSFCAIGQNKLSEPEILGTWNIISLDMGDGMYINLENDSVHIADSLKSNWKTEADSTIAYGMLKGMAGVMKQMVITIEPGGIFQAQMGPKGGDGTYVITENKVVLTLKNKKDPLTGSRENEFLRFDSGKGNNRLIMYFRRE